MDEEPSTTSSKDEANPPGSSPLIWLAGGLIGTVAISLVAAHAPPRIRLIGLFSIVFGLAIGWSLSRLAEKLECRISQTDMGVVVVILSVAGLIGCTWETWRLEEVRKPKSGNDAIVARMIEQMKLQTSIGQARSVPNQLEMVPPPSSSLTEFRRYLARRIRQLGEWSSPWPEAFWLLEICAGAAASVWIAIRGPQTNSQVSESRTTSVT